VREADTVARLGGDEFVVMLEGLSKDVAEASTQAEAVAGKVMQALNQPYDLGTLTRSSTPSVGITVFGKQQESLDEPLRRADLAMYQAKAAGRNTSRLFDPKTQAAVTLRADLEAALRTALEEEQFVLYLQPQISEDVRVTGAEALIPLAAPHAGSRDARRVHCCGRRLRNDCSHRQLGTEHGLQAIGFVGIPTGLCPHDDRSQCERQAVPPA